MPSCAHGSPAVQNILWCVKVPLSVAGLSQTVCQGHCRLPRSEHSLNCVSFPRALSLCSSRLSPAPPLSVFLPPWSSVRMKYAGRGLRIRSMEAFTTHPLWVYWGEQVGLSWAGGRGGGWDGHRAAEAAERKTTTLKTEPCTGNAGRPGPPTGNRGRTVKAESPKDVGHELGT